MFLRAGFQRSRLSGLVKCAKTATIYGVRHCRESLLDSSKSLQVLGDQGPLFQANQLIAETFVMTLGTTLMAPSLNARVSLEKRVVRARALRTPASLQTQHASLVP